MRAYFKPSLGNLEKNELNYIAVLSFSFSVSHLLALSEFTFLYQSR